MMAQSEELSKELFDELWDASLILKDTRRVAEDWFNDVKELIIQDRKQHELELLGRLEAEAVENVNGVKVIGMRHIEAERERLGK